MKDLHSNWIVLLLVAILGAALLLSLFSGLANAGTKTITVTATGTASEVPSAAQISLYANGTGISASSATASLSSTLSALNSTLATYVNGNMSNITTSSYSLRQVNDTKNPYVATEWIYLTVNADKAGALVGSLAEIPNVYVSSTSRVLSKQQSASLLNSAISLAMANATSQARAAAGTSAMLKVTNVTISNYHVYYPVYGASIVPTASKIASPVFYPGTADVTSTVYVVFTYGE